MRINSQFGVSNIRFLFKYSYFVLNQVLRYRIDFYDTSELTALLKYAFGTQQNSHIDLTVKYESFFWIIENCKNYITFYTKLMVKNRFFFKLVSIFRFQYFSTSPRICLLKLISSYSSSMPFDPLELWLTLESLLSI